MNPQTHAFAFFRILGRAGRHAGEIVRLREALDNSQSLLVAMLLEKRPESEIEEQIKENRAALGGAAVDPDQ